MRVVVAAIKHTRRVWVPIVGVHTDGQRTMFCQCCRQFILILLSTLAIFTWWNRIFPGCYHCSLLFVPVTLASSSTLMTLVGVVRCSVQSTCLLDVLQCRGRIPTIASIVR